MSYPKEWQPLKEQANKLKQTHLSELLSNSQRNKDLFVKFGDLVFDFTHQKINQETLSLLEKLAQQIKLSQRINNLFNGKHINQTQDRAVLHTCLRAPKDSIVHPPETKEIIENVHNVLSKVQKFSEKVRNGDFRGATGKQLQNLILIGIGGSYLSIEFVYQALRNHPGYHKATNGRKLRFLANVDPIDFSRAVQGLDAQQTLVLINSKTFTTAQTILNAKSVKKWLLEQYKNKGLQDTALIVKSHMCACSTNLEKTSQFGIDKENVFEFWDFVGGRFSVWSCIGVLPLSIHFGYQVTKQFLKGGHQIDKHLVTQKDYKKNIAALLGLLGFYRTTMMGYSARAIVPYCQALAKFAPHIQQLDMESNGKRVSLNGQKLEYETAVVNFGQPGTNGQHSFFQLLHQGRVIPVEFIGFTKSQTPVQVQGEAVSNHDQLMSNFFSQPDALAIGKSQQKLKAENVPQKLLEHKLFPGDRPSSSILFLGELDAFKCGQLLSLYQHRTSVEGFIWNVNSYDQWGVELGKVLAKKIRSMLQNNKLTQDINSATRNLAQIYLDNKK